MLFLFLFSLSFINASLFLKLFLCFHSFLLKNMFLLFDFGLFDFHLFFFDSFSFKSCLGFLCIQFCLLLLFTELICLNFCISCFLLHLFCFSFKCLQFFVRSAQTLRLFIVLLFKFNFLQINSIVFVCLLLYMNVCSSQFSFNFYLF